MAHFFSSGKLSLARANYGVAGFKLQTSCHWGQRVVSGGAVLGRCLWVGRDPAGK